MSTHEQNATPDADAPYIPSWRTGDNEVHRALQVARPVVSGFQQVAVIQCAILSGIVIVWLVGSLAATALGVPARYVYMFWALLTIGVLVMLLRLGARAYMKAVKFKRQQFGVAETWRVAIIGRTGDQDEFGEVQTENFEPIIVPARVGHRSKVQFARIAIVSIGIFLFFIWNQLPSAFAATFAFQYYLLAILGGGVASVVLGFVYPVYYRVVPGALDIVRYPFLGIGRPIVERFDLHACRVTVLAQRKIVLIDDPAVPPTPIGKKSPLIHGVANNTAHHMVHATVEVNVALNRGSMEIVRMIAAAAISAYPTPPLPDDQLVG